MRNNLFASTFKSILLENTDGAVERPIHQTSTDAGNEFLEDDTDPMAFAVEGIKSTFEAIQNIFNNKMTEFSSTLAPENIQNLSLDEINDEIDDVFNFVDKIQILSSGKIDQISRDPYAIMAAFLSSEPTKLAAFKKLHKNLSDAQSVLDDLDGMFGTLRGEIEGFVKDIQEVDSDEAAEDVAQQMTAPAPPGGGGGSPAATV